MLWRREMSERINELICESLETSKDIDWVISHFIVQGMRDSDIRDHLWKLLDSGRIIFTRDRKLQRAGVA